MKADLQKFMELVKTDEALQKKLEEAAKNYEGEQTQEAFFDDVVVPAAKESGFSFTFDSLKKSEEELNLDEMKQIAGGGWGGGLGAVGCDGLGFGFGGGYDGNGGGGCFVIGGGTKVNMGCCFAGINDPE